MKGCQGGLATDAFQYVEDNDGIESEDDNPYTAGDGDDSAACVEDGNYAATISGFSYVADSDEDALKEAVAQQARLLKIFFLKYKMLHFQPVAVAIDASHKSFQLYSGGISNLHSIYSIYILHISVHYFYCQPAENCVRCDCTFYFHSVNSAF